MIFLDTCIYGRSFDRPQTPEILADVAAIRTIINKCRQGGHLIVGSPMISFEIGKISNAEIRANIEAL